MITGASASGKTALLEALLIAGKGQPAAVLRVNQSRNLTETALHPGMVMMGAIPPFPQLSPSQFKQTWLNLFGDESKPLTISYADSEGLQRSLKIQFGVPQGGKQLFPVDPKESGPPASAIFERTAGDKNEVATVSLNQLGQMVSSGFQGEFGRATFFFASQGHYIPRSRACCTIAHRNGAGAARCVIWC